MTAAGPVHVLAIATAVPEHVCSKQRSVAIAREVFADRPDTLAFLERLLAASGIETRHAVVPDYTCAPKQRTLFPPSRDFRPEPDTKARNQVFTREAPRLALQACAALPATDWRSRVTHLVTASCTGFSAPGFDIALVRALGLSPRVHRTHVGFMGCYAGFTTLKLADALCRADPDALALVVHVELCSLHVRFRPDPDALIADTLFADGAAAALLGGERHLALGQAPLRLLGAAAFLLPSGDDAMTWTIGQHGFDMTLSPRVPHVLRQHLPAACATLLEQVEASPADVEHWAIHPGGPAILDQAKQALGIDEPAVAVSREVLSRFGNMSSATIWFVLDGIRRRDRRGLVYACGFGPGLTLESALLAHPGAA